MRLILFPGIIHSYLVRSSTITIMLVTSKTWLPLLPVPMCQFLVDRAFWMTYCHWKLWLWFDDTCGPCKYSSYSTFSPSVSSFMVLVLKPSVCCFPQHLIPTLSLSCELWVHIPNLALLISWYLNLALSLAAQTSTVTMQFCTSEAWIL